MGKEAGEPVGAEESKLDPREVFKKEKKRFGVAVRIAVAVSKAAAGRNPDGSIVMASYVFTRMCVAADTLLYMLRRESGYQFYFASYAVAHTRLFLLQSVVRLAESDDAVRQKIDAAMFDELKELAAIPFGE
jgi:hypothetical protein